MPIEVLTTKRAKQQIAALTGRVKRTFDAFLDDLSNRGCAALTYRLSGRTPLDHICVKHLWGNLRVAVGFESPQQALILLVAPHDDEDAAVNIYDELYRMLGAEPEADEGRSKPPCCDEVEQLPPVLGSVVDNILATANEIRRTRRSR